MIERIDSLSNGHTTLSQEIINFDKELEYRAGFLTQMRWLLWRNCISEFRNPNALRIQLVQSIVSILTLVRNTFFNIEMKFQFSENELPRVQNKFQKSVQDCFLFRIVSLLIGSDVAE